MPDSQINYLFQQPNGDVLAIFPGGVQMTAEQPAGTTAPADKSVSWTRQADGAVVAHVKASTSSDTSGTQIEISTYKPPFTGNSPFRFAELVAKSAPDGQSPHTEIFAELSDEADTGIIVRRIINSNLQSDFIQNKNLSNQVFASGVTAAIGNGAAAVIATGLGALGVVVAQPQQIGLVGQGGWNCDHGGGPGNFTIYNNTGFAIPFDWMASGTR